MMSCGVLPLAHSTAWIKSGSIKSGSFTTSAASSTALVMYATLAVSSFSSLTCKRNAAQLASLELNAAHHISLLGVSGGLLHCNGRRT